MSTPIPIPPSPPPSPGLAPSGSTTTSAIAAFLAASIVWGLGQKQIFFPAGFEGLLCGAISALAGYLPASGRK